MFRSALVISLFLLVRGGSSASNVIPHHYSIQFNTDVQNGEDNFRGTVWIDFEILETVDQLELQARNLTIQDVTMKDREVGYMAEPNGQLLVFPVGELSKGSYQLEIAFSGSASHHDVMIKGSYQRSDNSTGHYLMSKPRKSDFNVVPSAFPHFGEEFKATFKISVVHHDSLTAWSNMPLQNPPKAHDREHYVMSSFRETPTMHVFDVGFFVSDFGSQKFGNLTVVARDGVLQSTEYVGSLGNDLVRIMDEHTAVDYSGPTAEYVYIVLPREFDSQNLTEFERMIVEEEYMLYDREKDGINRLYWIFARTSYRLMLQWLGNLIAPEEERLHQGFSNIYTFFNAEKVYPEERLMLMYQLEVLQTSLFNGAESPSCVINMFWLMILDDKWRVLMRNLMKNRKPRTLTAAQLWSKAQTLFPEDYNVPEGTTLDSIFNQWMDSDELSPKLHVQRLYSDGKVSLSQNGSERILPFNHATEFSHFNQLGPFQWLTSRNATVKLDGPDDHWLIVNKEGFGFYRVNYDERNWRLIIEALRANASSIQRFNRMQMMDDALYFVLNDELDITILLELVTYLRGERFYVAWFNAYNILTIGYYFEFEPPTHIKTFFLHLIEPYYQSFASQEISKSTPQMELYIRSQMADVMCWLGNEDCLQRTRSGLQQAITDNAPVEPNWAATIYCYGMQNGTDEELEWLLTVAQRADLSRAVDYLSCVDNEHHLRRVLEVFAEKANVKTISRFIRSLDEMQFEMLHSLLKSDPDLVKLLKPSTIERSLKNVAKFTRSSQTLRLIDDLMQELGLKIPDKGLRASMPINIWAKPEVAAFIERYMKEVGN